jgi:hypothetical protein
MDYLVVAPHTPFFHWQVALLIESFRFHGMEENLAVLLVAGSEDPAQSEHCASFLNHPRLKAVRLATDSEPDIRRLHGVTHAVATGFVSQTFALLPPHSILRHPITPPTANITVDCKSDFTFNHLSSFGISTDSLSRRFSGRKTWLPVGDVFLFNGLMPDFFNIAFDSYRECFKKKEGKSVKGLFRAAMSTAIMEVYGRIKLDTTRHLECHMNEHDHSANVVNYYYGSPPNFSRAYYSMSDTGVTFSDDPYKGILRSEDSAASTHMKQIVYRLKPQLSAEF